MLWLDCQLKQKSVTNMMRFFAFAFAPTLSARTPHSALRTRTRTQTCTECAPRTHSAPTPSARRFENCTHFLHCFRITFCFHFRIASCSRFRFHFRTFAFRVSHFRVLLFASRTFAFAFCISRFRFRVRFSLSLSRSLFAFA